jgi:hypothetical protein
MLSSANGLDRAGFLVAFRQIDGELAPQKSVTGERLEARTLSGWSISRSGIRPV